MDKISALQRAKVVAAGMTWQDNRVITCVSIVVQLLADFGLFAGLLLVPRRAARATTVHCLLACAGWIGRQQLTVIEYLKAENRILRERLKTCSLRFSDVERALLARKAYGISRKVLLELGTIVTPDTLLRWHRPLIARKSISANRFFRRDFFAPLSIFGKFRRDWFYWVMGALIASEIALFFLTDSGGPSCNDYAASEACAHVFAAGLQRTGGQTVK